MKSWGSVKSWQNSHCASAILFLALNLKSMCLFVYFHVPILSSNDINTGEITSCHHNSTEIGRFCFKAFMQASSLIRLFLFQHLDPDQERNFKFCPQNVHVQHLNWNEVILPSFSCLEVCC